MTDAGLLAEATVWAATNPECANQAFNINNGDLFRWQEMWPKIAAFFDMDVAPPLPMSLDVAMADKESVWDELVEEHHLARTPYSDVSSWGSVTSYSDGTTTFSLTDRKLGGSDFTATSTPKRCSSTSSPICRLGR